MKIFLTIKKVTLCLIITILLTSCSIGKKYQIPPESELNIITDSNSVIIKTEKAEYSLKDNEVRYEIVNNSENVFSKEKEDFILQKYENGKWNKYSFRDDRIFTYEFYEFNLSKSENIEFVIILKQHFDMPMNKGYYRIMQFGLTSNVFSIK